MTQLLFDVGSSVVRQRPAVRYIMHVCLCVNITVCGKIISPETVSTDGVSLVTLVMVHGAGGKTDTRVDGVFYLVIAFSAWCRWWL